MVFWARVFLTAGVMTVAFSVLGFSTTNNRTLQSVASGGVVGCAFLALLSLLMLIWSK